MDFIENIQYRNMLDAKARRREKLTKEEKEWFATNPMYNEKYTEPIYQQDVIKLCNNKAYSITVKLKDHKGSNEIIPVISTVLGKGKITAHKYDEDGAITQFDTKALGVLISPQYPISTFDFISPNGYMRIEYQCQYFDPKMKLYIRCTSIANFAFGMRKEQVSDNEIIYYCKHPLANYGDFSSYTFSVECNEKITE